MLLVIFQVPTAASYDSLSANSLLVGLTKRILGARAALTHNWAVKLEKEKKNYTRVSVGLRLQATLWSFTLH